MPLVYADSSVLFADFHLLNGIDEFWTCDIAQAGLAKAAGLETRLFGLKRV